MTNTSKIHRHVATHYEIENADAKSLGAVLIAIEPQSEMKPDSDGSALPYQVGDHLYLAEGWNGCESMHPEEKGHQFSVVNVAVTQGKWLTSADLIAAGLLDKDNEVIRNCVDDDALIEQLGNQVMDLFNNAHPRQLFDRQAWYILISLEPLSI